MWLMFRHPLAASGSSTMTLPPLYSLSFMAMRCSLHCRRLGTSKRIIVREGHQTELPCDLRSASSNDSLAVIRWPPARRSSNLLQVNPSAGTGWVGRADFSIIGHPASLKVNSVRFEDAGVYTCTAMFRDGARRNSTVRLHVVAEYEQWRLEACWLKGIRRGEIPISAGLPAEIVCEAWGSRPPPVVTWWKGLQQLNHTFVYVSTDGNVTTSVVSFTPASDDHVSNL
ncbi:hypothetical protein HPB47_004406 [Ixodes persulcatus]|uniref:Uncharacterized protein n=1 Tax=Ixodes persulcatus TaxID=34615 RepID=A0AC60PFR6_IXOPE|nr:hypothetical protein HPB47_004406 [Ixodes persulcatus]